jgi:aminoglycoside 6'-N-acetyltransferase I
MNIRPVETRDRADWLRMRRTLWTDDDTLEAGIEAHFASPRLDVIVFMAEATNGKLIGFAEVGTRAYAEGCETSPVGFLEGWFVEEHARGSGVGRALVQAAETWTRERGLTEFGSDTWLENEASILAHQALGFAVAERLVCFLKRL